MSNVTPEIEKVARAINEADTRARLGAVATRVDMSRNYLERRDACLAMARSALLAIREPTERMVEAAGISADMTVPKYSYSFTRAIDAALGEDKG